MTQFCENMDTESIISAEEAEEWLTEHGVMKDEKGKWSPSAASIAVSYSNLQVLKWLHSVDMLYVNEKNTSKTTIAHNAAWYGQVEILKWLFAVGLLDAKAKDELGRNIAHCAAWNEGVEVLEWLHSLGLLDGKDITNGGDTVGTLALVDNALIACLPKQFRCYFSL